MKNSHHLKRNNARDGAKARQLRLGNMAVDGDGRDRLAIAACSQREIDDVDARRAQLRTDVTDQRISQYRLAEELEILVDFLCS